MHILEAVTLRVGACWVWQGGTVGPGYANPGPLQQRQPLGLAPRVPVHQQLARRHPAWSPGCEARHTCGNRLCVNPEHIIPGTKHQNMQDCVKHRTHNKVKLQPEQVLAIRSDPRTSPEIAAEYGVSPCSVRQVKQRTTWGWL